MERTVTIEWTRDDLDDWVLEQYRNIVGKAGVDGIKKQAVAAEIALRLHSAISDGQIALPVDIEGLVERIIHVRDEGARRKQVDHVRFVADCINGATILGEADPIMDQVCLAGDGIRKAWRHVGIDDLNAMVSVKTQHAADASVAANDFQQQARIIVRHLLANHGADGTIGDVFP